MIRNASPATLVVTSCALGLAGFAAGFATSSAFPASPADVKPIVNEHAWEETAPAQPVSYAQPVQPRCNPWQVSDIAMEEVLDQMIRRGWRAPTQGNAVALLDTGNISALDPNAPMPSRNRWVDTTSSDEDAADEADNTQETEPAEPPPVQPPTDRPPS